MESPSAFPMTLEDCIMHEVLPVFSDGSLKFLLSLAGRIDEDRLRKAVRLSLDAEPILGCRFVECGRRFAWERREDLDEIPLCEVVAGSDGRPYLAQFLATPIDTARDPLVKVIVVRATPTQSTGCPAGCPADTVCIKVAHEVADGPSAKDYVHLLFRLYRRLKDDPRYRPQPNPAGVRSVSEVFRHLGLWKRLGALCRLGSMRGQGRDRGQWLLPRYDGHEQEHRYVYLLMKLPAERVRLLKEYSRQRKARITAVLLAAYYRALRTVSRPVNEDAVEIRTSVDLRRFLPPGRRSSTPGNIFVPFSFCLDGHRDFSFDELVNSLTAQLQQAFLDPFRSLVGIAIVMDLIARTLGLRVIRMLLRGMVKRGANRLRSQRSLACVLVNYGTLAPEPGAAGDAPIVDAHFLGGAVHAEELKLGVSGFQENMTFSFGFSDRFVEESALRRLLEEVDKALPFFSGVPANIVSIADIVSEKAENAAGG